MTMHNILLTVQYITISVLFVEILILFLKWKNPIHSYLFLACVATFISNLGYLFELKAGSEEAYITALKISYAGRVWIVLAFFLFAARMCGKKIHEGVVAALVAVHVGIYMSVLTLEKTGLYYKDYNFVTDSVFPKFYHGNGVIHDLLIGLNVVFILFAMNWVIRAYRQEVNKAAKLRFLTLLMAFGVQVLSFVLQISGLVGISKYYDLTMPGTLLGTVFVLIGIVRFDLLGTREIARDFVIDRISEGIIAVDKFGRIRYFNEPAAKIYPEFDLFFSANEAPGKRSIAAEKSPETGAKELTAVHYNTPYDILSSIEKAAACGKTLKINERIYTPEENELLYQGENYGKLYALVDTTDHYRYLEELQVQKDIADRANESKSRFLANMSHEIRTPINAVLGMDEMILRESTEKTVRGYAADIMSAGKTLLSLINDILDLSKVEEGKIKIIPVQYDLSSLVADLVNMIRERAEKKGLKLNVNADSHTPNFLIGDEIRIRQCVMNLLTNAVKYTNAGEVKLNVSFDKKDEEHIFLSFSVEDTGIGMKEEDMEKLFSPYERLEEKRNRAIEGTGLGMSITRQLLDLMGSELKVKSEYGKGSVFWFEIRQSVAKWDEIGDLNERLKAGKGAEYEYHELFHAPDAGVLVVDDTEINLTVIKSLLKQTGIKVDTASSGKEALSLSDANKYDVIFIDHMMPDMDGIETLKHLRDSGMNTDTPAVALTANAISGARDMYLKAGFTDYMSKPIDGEKLERMLLLMLPESKVLKQGDDGFESEHCKSEDADRPGFDEFYKNLAGVDEIDEKAGLSNCGSDEGYLSVINVFHQTADAKADEIKAYYDAGDIENYTIKVHALKSSARIIGATELSDLAKSLEDAGKRGDLSLIRENTDRLLSMYKELDLKLKWLDEEEKDLPEIEKSALKEAYETMIELSGSMDYELMDGMLSDLSGYRLPKADSERISRIKQKLTELDWEGIAEISREAFIRGL